MARNDGIARFEIGKTYVTLVGAYGYEREDRFTVVDRTAHAVRFTGDCDGWAAVEVDHVEKSERSRLRFGLADEFVYADSVEAVA